MSEKAQQFQDFLFVLIVITEFMVIKADYGMYVNVSSMNLEQSKLTVN